MRGVLSCATEASTVRRCASAVKLLFPCDGVGAAYNIYIIISALAHLL